MPVYDYLCTACDHRADILHGINDPGPNFCPSCGSEGTMRKQFAAPAIHFKGSGWAKKDRGSSTMTRAAARSSPGDGDSSGSGDGARDGSGDGDSSGSGDGARDGSGDGARKAGQGTAKGGSTPHETPASTAGRAPKPNATE